MCDAPDIFPPVVRAGILQLEAKRREERKTALECLRECFDLIAGDRLETHGTLSETEVNQQIPELLFEAAVEFGWIAYPRQRQVRRVRTKPDAWIPGSKVVDWVWVTIPEADLVEDFGRFRVEAGFTAWLRKLLGGRILHWQGQRLKRQPADSPPKRGRPGQAEGTALGTAPPQPEILPHGAEESRLPAEDGPTPAAAQGLSTQPTVGIKGSNHLRQEARKKRGRPSKIPDELKRKALEVKGGKARAQILYQTKYPTPQQVKNVPAILRHYVKRQPGTNAE